MNEVESNLESALLDEQAKRKQLEKQISEKEAELARYKKMLVQSTKMATLGTLSVDAASEINTPLLKAIGTVDSFNYSSPIITSVLNISEQYLNGELKESQFKHELDLLNLQHPFAWISNDLSPRIKESASTLKQVNYCVQNLLNFMDSNEHHAMQLVNMADVANNILRLLESQLKLCAVNTHFEDTSPIYCNLASTNQLFVNLLLNARDACEHNDTKGCIVDVSIFEKDNYICVEIKDNGCGMSNQVQEQMFDPFFTTKEVGKNTGMGLTLVQSIMQEHAGKVHVNSILETGTSISCLFPLKA